MCGGVEAEKGTAVEDAVIRTGTGTRACAARILNSQSPHAHAHALTRTLKHVLARTHARTHTGTHRRVHTPDHCW